MSEIDINKMEDGQYEEFIDSLSEDTLHAIAQRSMPWSSGTRINNAKVVDEDGFPIWSEKDILEDFSNFQKVCWKKFQENPQINSHVRDYMGSLTGYGFGFYSAVSQIQDVLDEIVEDPRNELYRNISKYVARSEVQGELFLSLTLHEDGFVEVDFIEPTKISSDGIIQHPNKKTMPLAYKVTVDKNTGTDTVCIPSIYIAYYPDLLKLVKDKITDSEFEKSTNRKYKKIGGFKRFIVSWDRGYLTNRNVSHLRTTLEWINHYENLKKWEIDHKKSSGSYLWVVKMEDAKAFRTWLKMTDEDRAATGLTAKKTPGGTLILPPGISITCENPKLSSISDQDTDIMTMVTSGLNRPEDMVTGKSSGSTFSGVKATRGPQSDRIQDEIAYFERFLIFDFWRHIFYLKSIADSSFKLEYNVMEAVSFSDDGVPKMKKVKKKAHKLITVNFPVSEVQDLEGKAKAYLGVKHPSLVETLGIPRAEIAKRLGFPSYIKNRLQFETEEKTLPDLPTIAELDSAQESVQEPSINRENKTKKVNSETNSDKNK